MPDPHLHLNGLSIGGGGGYTVGYELLRHIAVKRPHWRVSLSLIEGAPLHEEMRDAPLPTNASILWGPTSALGRAGRQFYERKSLPTRLAEEGVSALVQLNGQLIPTPIPTLCHFQDPFPYRFDLVRGLRERALALLRRRGHARALRRAAAIGFTSEYLRDLISDYHGVPRTRGRVFYNGVPEDWIARAREDLPAWDGRPMELLTVSNVSPYKQQQLVIRALAELRRRPGLEDLRYRIVGECAPPEHRRTLERLAEALGIATHVIIEGRVPRERVEWAFRRARCFVLMSRCESFGLPAIEAMTFGTPVVVADGSAMPEVVGDAAVVVPAGNVGALVDAIAEALDPARAADLRQRGRKRVEAFPWRVTAQAMAEWAETASGESRNG